MILDKQNLFSDQQAVTVTAASTNVINLGQAKNLEPGHPLPLLVQVTESFATLTSLTIAVQESVDEVFTAPITLVSTVVPVASLVAGYKLPIRNVPATGNKYLRMYYTVTGSTATAGKITAGFTPAIQDWVATPDSL